MRIPTGPADSGILIPVILCGGAGSRLWPLSRALHPKQFLRLVGEASLLQDTVRRLGGMPAVGRSVVVTNEAHRFLVAEQLRDIHAEADILLEPAARNTAPAIAAAAHWARSNYLGQSNGAAPLLLVLPSDHVITNVVAFQQAVLAGMPHAQAGKLVTFGVVADRPETGYGYIRRGAPVAGGFVIERFVEKPDADKAASYLAGGNYYWNSGMFLFSADAFLERLSQLAPDISVPAGEAVAAAQKDLDFVRLDAGAFNRCRADSIDYAVMEKATDSVVVPLNAGWNDIGAWNALTRSQSADAQGNHCRGDVMAYDTRSCLVRAESRLVATIGLEDMIVIETADAVLVAPKGRAQDVKHIVERLQREGRTEIDLHTVVHRPWGSYEAIADGSRYQVKRIVVKPGRALSLQKHHHRAEHWVVAKGAAKVTRGEETIMLAENESTYIPLGAIHRLENPGKIDLELVEIQIGSYLGEDDIVRFEDTYGRSA